MLTEPRVLFFGPSRAVLRAILRDEYLTSAVRTEEGDKEGSNQPPERDPVQFTLELTPNYLISSLENTGSRSTRYVSMPHPNESSVLPKFLEKSDAEVARPAFSTWLVHKTQPKAFEVCASIQIHQSAYHDRWQFETTTLPHTGMFVWSRYADWWLGTEYCQIMHSWQCVYGSELEPARIRQVVFLLVNFSRRVKLTGSFIVTLIAHSVDAPNFLKETTNFSLFSETR